jgi:hypothetical protein
MLQQLAEKNGRMRKNNGPMHCIAVLFSSFVVSFGNSLVLGKLLDTASAVLSLIDRWVAPVLGYVRLIRISHKGTKARRYLLGDLCVFVPP